MRNFVVLIKPALPNRAPAVELVIGQLVCSSPFKRESDGLRNNHRPQRTRSAHPPYRTGTSNNSHSVPELYDLLSVTVETEHRRPSVFAQEINNIIAYYTLCPEKVTPCIHCYNSGKQL